MKQPNWKTPLILSATLFGVGTFAYWLQYSHKPKKDKADTETKKPISLPADDTQIAMIRVKSTRGLIELKCESLSDKKCNGLTDGKWILTNPMGPNGIPYPADLMTVKEVLNGTNNAVAPELIDLTEETSEKRKSLMNDYGLSDEKRTTIETQFIEFVTADAQGKPGKRYTAWFGVEHPIGDKTFVASAVEGAVNDKTVFLISNSFKNSTFGKTVTNFREKALFNFDRNSVDEITSNKFKAKKTNGIWTINGFEGSNDRIGTVLSAISNSKASEFVDESMIKGLKPVISYTVKSGNQTHSIELFEKILPAKAIPGSKEKLPAEKHYYARTSGIKEIVEVESILRNNIDKKLSELRNTLILTDAEKITATKIKAEAPSYSAAPEFEYANGNWKAKDAAKNWDANIGSKLLNLLAMTRIQDFVSPVPSGKEIVKLTIGDDKNPAKFKMSFFTAKDKLYARNLNDKNNEAYLMEESMKSALPKTENEWKLQNPTTNNPAPAKK